jgi:Uma2 family endonuclease
MSAASLAPEDLVLDPEPNVLDEIVDGQVTEKIMCAHEVAIAGRIAAAINRCAEPKGLGVCYCEMLYRLRERSPRRRPDVSFVADQTWPMKRRVPSTNAWAVVPDLAIEVISPNDQADEISAKLSEYFAANAREVWSDWRPLEHVYVYRSLSDVRALGTGDAIDGGAGLPGFRQNVGALFLSETE